MNLMCVCNIYKQAYSKSSFQQGGWGQGQGQRHRTSSIFRSVFCDPINNSRRTAGNVGL